MFSDLFRQISFVHIFLSAILFMAGIYLAPYAVEKNIRWLLAYPRWIARLMEKYFNTRWGFLTLFLLIFSLNNLSLFTGFLSGFLVVLPVLIAFLTGFHVAVIGYDMMGWKGIWHLLVNPVAWLEFPAAWISLALGFRLAQAVVVYQDGTLVWNTFRMLLPLYFNYVFTLLLIAALLESALIRFAEKHKEDI